jgi:hypothetical protein
MLEQNKSNYILKRGQTKFYYIKQQKIFAPHKNVKKKEQQTIIIESVQWKKRTTFVQEIGH